MSKLMEIIEKTPDFKKGTCSMTLLDTNFFQLTRNIGSKTGHTIFNAVDGDILSKEMLRSLNQKQLNFIPRFENFVNNKYNSWINSTKKTIPNLENFNLVFTSLRDYSSKYIPGETQADYYLLSEVVGAEKELYETLHYWLPKHYNKNRMNMAEWSKNRPYGSNVSTMKSDELETQNFTPIQSVRISENNYPALQIRITHNNDKVTLHCDNPHIIPLGATARIVATIAYHNYPEFPLRGFFRIIRHRLGVAPDDGYFHKFECYAVDGYWYEKVNRVSTIEKYLGVTSPHFTGEIATDLNWLKKRILK